MYKKVIKINFKYFGDVFNPEDNLFTNSLRKFYKVIISEKPDYLFYSIYPEKNIKHDVSKEGDLIKRISPRLYGALRKSYSKIVNFSIKGKLPLPPGNYKKIFVGLEYGKPNMKECDWAFGLHFEEEIKNPRYMRMSNRITDYQLPNFGFPPEEKKIDFKKIKKEKTKFCNFIYSQDIPARNNFFKELSKYKKIDAPGRCMTNMSPIKAKNARESRRSENWVLTKLDFLRRYKFTIAFENFSAPGWTTEKLTHPMLVNSIPLYVGHKDVNKDFNTKSFINFQDFGNMKDFIKYIIKVDQDENLYKEILRAPWYKDSKMPKDFDNNRFFKRLKKIFD
ncbi:MAG: glycosyltransferase family 10 [archaeon]|nr:glycosyltransferase family 10 [archaeon]